MASDIEITSLSVTPGVGTATLRAEWKAPEGMGCLSYMQAASVVFYIGASTNFGSATEAGESHTGVLAVPGLPEGLTRRFWARAKDAQGNLGPVHGPVTAVILTAQPGPNSVGSDELQNGAVDTQHIANLAVTNAKIASLSADKIAAGEITAAISIQGPTITGGTITGGTITGGNLTTTSGANRVQMNGFLNEFSVYRSGSKVARIAGTTSSGFDGLIAVSNSAAQIAYSALVSGSGSSPAAYIVRNGAGGGIVSACLSSASGSSGVSGSNTTGGQGFLGLSSGDGGYGVYAGGGGYGPFTGAHDGLILKGDPAEPGDIVYDKRVMARNGWGDTLTEVGRTSEHEHRGIVGVIDMRVALDPETMLAALPAPEHGPKSTFVRRKLAEKYDRVKINALGEGQMNVCGRGGDLAAGDLICASDLAGKGERQSDDVVRGWTVAKAREAVTFDDPDQIKIVSVIYLCG